MRIYGVHHNRLSVSQYVAGMTRIGIYGVEATYHARGKGYGLAVSFCWDRACTSRSYLGGWRLPSSSARTASMMRLVAYSMLISLVLMTKW